MDKITEQEKALNGLLNDLQVFIELSLQNDEISLKDWIKETINKLGRKCWEEKNCNERNCPAYKNECGRCWIIAGTMCGDKPQGKFVEKYSSCMECEFYKNIIGNDRICRLREFIIVLIYSLRLKQRENKEALSEIKTLNGLLPICAHCKKIRDDKGYWNQLEAYITNHSKAEFSHGICPECAKKIYPDVIKKILNE